MKREHLLIALFFSVAAVSFFLFYEIVIPFFVPICWAAVFSILFYPLYDGIRSRIHSPGLASLVVCGIIIILIIGPVTYLFVALVGEAVDAVGTVNEMYKDGRLQEVLDIDVPFVATIKAKLNEYFDISKIDLDELVKDAINRVSGGGGQPDDLAGGQRHQDGVLLLRHDLFHVLLLQGRVPDDRPYQATGSAQRGTG